MASNGRSAWRGPVLLVSLGYALVAGAWVALSDLVVVSFTQDPGQIERWSTYKGWAFVLVTAGVIHLGLKRALRRRDAMLAELGASEAQARRLVETSPDAILIQDGYRIAFANEAALRLLGGREVAELVGRPIFDILDPSEHESVRDRTQRVVEEGATLPKVMARRLRRLDGVEVRAETAVARFAQAGLPTAMMVTIRDVTQAWRLQEELRRLNAALRMLGACNEALVRAGSEAELMQEVCRIAVQHGGYRLAWAGTPEQDEGRTIRAVAVEGLTHEQLVSFRPCWGEQDGRVGPAGQAILTGEPVVVNDMVGDQRCLPWRAGIDQLGLRSGITLPLSLEGQRLGVLALSATEVGIFDPAVVQLLRQLADDLAFGLVALRTRAALAQEREGLSESRRQLRALAARLEEVREEEKTRIARDLHDELGQLLTGLKMDLAFIERRLGELPATPSINALVDRAVGATGLVDQTVASVQRIAAELRSGVLDRLGLVPALRQEARRFQARTGIACEARLDEQMPEPPPEVGITLYRICQEAMTNVSRHAGASRVVLTLAAEPGAVVLSVEDDGRGLRPTDLGPAALGLLGMEERASRLGGAVRFSGGSERGTVVTARVPTTRPLEARAP